MTSDNSDQSFKNVLAALISRDHVLSLLKISSSENFTYTRARVYVKFFCEDIIHCIKYVGTRYDYDVHRTCIMPINKL